MQHLKILGIDSLRDSGNKWMLDGSGATKDEVDRAINTLTPTERLKLKHFAAWTVWGLGTASCGRSWEDLLGEAIATTLAGARNNGRGRTWRIADVDFVTHLSGAMRSIASHWRRDFREGKAHPESEVLTCTDDDDQISRLNQIASTDPSPESELIVRDILDRLSRQFPTSSGPGKVITGWKKDLPASDIMKSLNLSKSEYQQGVAQIRLCLHSWRLWPELGGVKGSKGRR